MLKNFFEIFGTTKVVLVKFKIIEIQVSNFINNRKCLTFS